MLHSRGDVKRRKDWQRITQQHRALLKAAEQAATAQAAEAAAAALTLSGPPLSVLNGVWLDVGGHYSSALARMIANPI